MRAEADRFYLDLTDRKYQTFMVIAYSDFVLGKSRQAFTKSVRGAIEPLDKAERELENVKKDELSDERRSEVEQAALDIAAMMEPVKKLMGQQVFDHATRQMIAKGFSPEVARVAIGVLPQFLVYHKLMKLTGTSH